MVERSSKEAEALQRLGTSFSEWAKAMEKQAEALHKVGMTLSEWRRRQEDATNR